MREGKEPSIPASPLYALKKLIPFATKMVFLTAIAGCFVWIASEIIHSSHLKKIYYQQARAALTEELIKGHEAFSHYAKVFHRSVRLFSAEKNFIEDVEHKRWPEKDTGQIRYHTQYPPWIPEDSELHPLVRPRYVLILDARGMVNQVYAGSNERVPAALLEPSRSLLLHSHKQGFIASLDGVYYLIAADSYFTGQGQLRATLLCASPVDAEFLHAAFGKAGEKKLAILMSEGGHSRLLTASDSINISAETTIDALRTKYLIEERQLPVSASSDLQVKLVSFASHAEIDMLADAAALKARADLLMPAVMLILFSAFIAYCIAGRYARDVSQQGRKKVAALLQGSRDVLELQDFRTIAGNVYDSCKKVVGAEAGYVALLNSDETGNDIVQMDTGRFSCAVNSGLPMPIRGMREKAYREVRVVYHNEFSKSDWAGNLPAGHAALDNVMFAPLVIGGKAVGLLGLANKPGGFSDADEDIALAFGEILAVALLRSRTVEALKNSERRFRSVVESAGDAIISIDSHGRIISWNPSAEHIFGFSFSEIAEKPLTVLIPERFADAHVRGLARVSADGNLSLSKNSLELAAVKKDGTEFPAELSLAAWKAGKETFFTGIIRDITERQRTAEALHKAHEELELRVIERTAELKSAVDLLRNEILIRMQKEDALIASQKRLQAVRKIGSMAGATLNWDEVLHAILKGTLEAAGASAGMVFIKNPDTGLLELEEAIGLSDGFVEAFSKEHVRIGEGLTGCIAQTGAPIYIAEDCSHDPRIDRLIIEEEGLNSFIGVPLYAASQLIGVLNILTRLPEVLNEDDVILVAAIGAQVGSAIKNAWLFEKQKKAETQIKVSLKEKEVMLQEIHHRVKSNLQLVCSMYSLQSRFAQDGASSEMLKECQCRIKAISLVHENMYQSENLSNINIGEYFRDLVRSLFSFHEINLTRIAFNMEMENIFLDISAAIPFGLIANELITNALLHAFPKERKGEVTVKLYEKDGDEIHLIIHDNGVGLPPDIDMLNIETLGFIIMKALINQLNGKIEIDRTGGTTFHVVFWRKQ